jgi:aryl-alcohol dehydrogenase-like predicted oxidoreductase
MKTRRSQFSRRDFIRTSATAAAGAGVFPYLSSCTGTSLPAAMTRDFGKIGFGVTTLGLGGQASLQWTSPTVNPEEIILKAFRLGVNYFDTSNYYGPSQSNYGRAFRKLGLIPGRPGYNESLRKSIFLTSKTNLKWAKGGYEIQGVYGGTNGDPESRAIDDVKRSLSQIFGDGTGAYPGGAYLDMVLCHSLNNSSELTALYEGIENTSPAMEHIGTLAGLRDLRDGTNLTGLNPKEEKLIRHIGFSGHRNAPAMMEMIRRDSYGLLDGMLVAINANDRLYLNMQYNVIPVAASRNMGIIAMKVFSDGAMYSKGNHWSNTSEHVVRTVGSETLPSRSLVQYSLTTPGIHTAITGIGRISDDPEDCQLQQNFLSAQVEPGGLGEGDREEIEKMTAAVKGGQTNYFQMDDGGLTAPGNAVLNQGMQGDKRLVTLAWDTSVAGRDPILKYEILRDGEKAGEVPHTPQTTTELFRFEDEPGNRSAHLYRVVAVDAGGNRTETGLLHASSV